MVAENLSKKQQKALSFRKSKEERTQEKIEKKAKKESDSSLKRKLDEDSEAQPSEKKSKTKEGKSKSEKSKSEKSKSEKSKSEKSKSEKSESKKSRSDKTKDEASSESSKSEAPNADGEPEKKKRKTRRGKKGKGVNGGKGPRFILFVGNLPYDTQQAELDKHFQNAKPDRIRIRREKGIAFLEFDNDNQAIQSKMDHALGMHHSIFRNRKINVELTVGGGGNSEVRTQKLKEKNDKLIEERKEKVKKELAKRTSKAEKESATTGGMHPARAALLKQ